MGLFRGWVYFGGLFWRIVWRGNAIAKATINSNVSFIERGEQQLAMLQSKGRICSTLPRYSNYKLNVAKSNATVWISVML